MSKSDSESNINSWRSELVETGGFVLWNTRESFIYDLPELIYPYLSLLLQKFWLYSSDHVFFVNFRVDVNHLQIKLIKIKIWELGPDPLLLA